MQLLVIAGAFLFGYCATYAGMKSLLALEARQPLRTANWGLLVNALSWSAVVLVVFTHNPPAIVADLFGCWLADYYVTPRARHADTSVAPLQSPADRPALPQDQPDPDCVDGDTATDPRRR